MRDMWIYQFLSIWQSSTSNRPCSQHESQVLYEPKAHLMNKSRFDFVLTKLARPSDPYVEFGLKQKGGPCGRVNLNPL